jgi:hypothetical protein
VLDACVDCFTVTRQSGSTTTANKTEPVAPRPARAVDCLRGGPFASAGAGQADNRRDGRRPAA